MKFRLLASFWLIAGLCPATASFAQTVRECGAAKSAVCTTGGGEWFWIESRLLRPVGVAGAPSRFASHPLATPALTADSWNTSAGNWNVAGNWTAGIPTSSDAVTIGTSGGDVTVNISGASAGTLSILSENELNVASGNSLNVSGTTSNAGYMFVGYGGAGTLSSGGSLTNTGAIYVGNTSNTAAAALTITGSLTNTGASLNVTGGSSSAGTALVNISGAAPSTLYGTYNIQSYAGSAAVEFGSGSITAIGSSSTAGSLTLAGPKAYLGVGAANNDNALASLTTIGYYGSMYMESGASLTTTTALTNDGGYLGLDNSGSGGSSLTIGSALTNTDGALLQIGNGGMSSASTLKVLGTINNSGGDIEIGGGGSAGANALLNVTGAAPSTLYGTFSLTGSTGSAAVEFGSGSITAIGSSSTVGSVSLNGSNAYMEIGATNNESALTSLNTIGYDSGLFLYNGASLTTTTALTNDGGYLEVDTGGSGGSTLTISGALTNPDTGDVYVGSSGMTAAATLKVLGTLNNSGGTIDVTGGGASGANALVNVTGAAPSTLYGNFDLAGNTGSAAVEFGSGSITAIGSSSVVGSVSLTGPNAYMEIGATNNESALASLNTIGYDGALFLYDGAALTTTGALTNDGGYLEVDLGGSGGSSVTIGGALTNTDAGDVYVGSSGMTAAATLKVLGTLNNSGGTIDVTGGGASGANALVNVTGAAPSTLEGTYDLVGNQGSASVEFGSGSITTIGDGSTNSGEVELSGPNAYMEIGATNSESALTGLKTVSSNGSLYLYNGVSLTTTKALTNDGTLAVDYGGNGGSTFSSNGSLTNNGTIYLGNGNTSATTTMKTSAAVTNSANGSVILYGDGSAGVNSVWELTGPTLSNSGTIELEGDTGKAILEIGANVTTSGKGSIQLSNTTTNLITGTSSSFTLTNGSTIEGSGTISNMGIVNTGTISANQSTPLLILPSSLGLNNQGTLSVSAGDTMQIGTSAGGALTNLSGTTLTGGTYTVGGTMQFGSSTASIVTLGANVSLTGAGAQFINFGGSSLLTNLATITSAGSLTLGTSWGDFTTTGNFTNDGTLSVGTGDKFIVDLSDQLTNFSGTTLTGGTYKINGTLEFAGANIVTNDASITLTGAGSKIDGKAGANGLANFAVNNGSFSLGKGRSFTTAGNFTNNGYLSVAAGDTFDVNGDLTNFSGTTLNSGNYSVSGALEFDNANIVTNAATITLGSTTAKIENQSAANAMLGFTTNTSSGSFTLSGNASLSTTGGSFTNAGTVTVNSGSTFTIGGSSYNYTQTAGTTTVNGTLAGAETGDLDLTGGNLYGTGTLDYGVSDSATITPGDSSSSTGKLQVDGTYAQNSSGSLDVTIGGTTAGTKYDQLNVSGTASLTGTLNITLASGYTPTVGTTFDILNASSISGSFSTVNGVAINSSEHFTVTEISDDEIELTVVSGAAPSQSVSLTPAFHPGLGRRHYGLAVTTPTLAQVPAAVTPTPVFRMPVRPVGSVLAGARSFHAMDDFGTPVAAASVGGSGDAGLPMLPGISPVSALAYNGMASMNHSYFECGVSLNALRHVGGKRLLRALWAAPDSPEALSIGYMTMIGAH